MNGISRTAIAGAVWALVIYAAPMTALAQVYKCTDSSGKTIYTGQPCEYGGKAIPITENVVKSERPPPDAYGGTTAYGGASGVSPECSQAMSALQDHDRKAMPSGIVDANRHRQNRTQLSNRAELACAGSRTGGSQSSGRREPVAGTGIPRPLRTGPGIEWNREPEQHHGHRYATLQPIHVKLLLRRNGRTPHPIQ